MASVVFGLTLMLLVGFFTHHLLARRGFSALPLWLSLGVFIFTGMLTQFPGSFFFIGLQDGASYLEWAEQIQQAWIRGESLPTSGMLPIWPGKGVWPLLIAIGSELLGDGLFWIVSLNSTLLSLSVVALQVATFLISGVRSKYAVTLIFLSNPAILLNGPTLLREATFWFGISIGILALSLLATHKLARGSGLLALGIVIIMLIRPNLGIFVVHLLVLLAAAILLFQKNFRNKRRIVGGVSLLLLSAITLGPSIVIFAESESAGGLQYRAAVIATSLSAEEVTTAITVDVNPISSAGEEVLPNQALISLVISSISRLPRAFLGPFPGEIGPEPVWIVAIASTAHFIVLLGLAFLFLVKTQHRTVLTAGLVTLALVVLSGLAMVMTNYGILLRFRVVSELLLSPISAGLFAPGPNGTLGRWLATVSSLFSKRGPSNDAK